jgi:hypothetical protein
MLDILHLILTNVTIAATIGSKKSFRTVVGEEDTSCTTIITRGNDSSEIGHVKGQSNWPVVPGASSAEISFASFEGLHKSTSGAYNVTREFGESISKAFREKSVKIGVDKCTATFSTFGTFSLKTKKSIWKENLTGTYTYFAEFQRWVRLLDLICGDVLNNRGS